MGTYKVLQDIEAEDKLLGPLSLRQFVYAAIVVTCLFIGFKLVTATGVWYLAIPLLPVILFFGMLAAPFGHDQSNEVWLLAKIRFALKPRKRLWDQSGLKELVTITVPKKIEKHLTKDFSKEEARSRLEALANTIDSRGWAVKNVSVNPFQQPWNPDGSVSSDRLINLSQVAQEVPEEVTAFDILDDYKNPTAENVDQLIDSSTQARLQKIQEIVRSGQTTTSPVNPPATQWFAGDPPQSNSQATTSFTQPKPTPIYQQPATITASTSPNPAPAIINHSNRDEPKITPANSPTNKQYSGTGQSTSVTEVDPAIIDLASNDDLNVATIARQADKVKVQSGDNEVVISLH